PAAVQVRDGEPTPRWSYCPVVMGVTSLTLNCSYTTGIGSTDNGAVCVLTLSASVLAIIAPCAGPSTRITEPLSDGPVARFAMPHESPQVMDGLSRPSGTCGWAPVTLGPGGLGRIRPARPRRPGCGPRCLPWGT